MSGRRRVRDGGGHGWHARCERAPRVGAAAMGARLRLAGGTVGQNSGCRVGLWGACAGSGERARHAAAEGLRRAAHSAGCTAGAAGDFLNGWRTASRAARGEGGGNDCGDEGGACRQGRGAFELRCERGGEGGWWWCACAVQEGTARGCRGGGCMRCAQPGVGAVRQKR